MSPVLLQLPETRWYCPSCAHEDVTRQLGAHSRMHGCPAMGGLSVPMVQAGVRARHVATEREDYIGAELVRFDAHGRPVMVVHTQYEDGRSDATVYAPTARGSGAA